MFGYLHLWEWLFDGTGRMSLHVFARNRSLIEDGI